MPPLASSFLRLIKIHRLTSILLLSVKISLIYSPDKLM
jgi:hypothetical protein